LFLFATLAGCEAEPGAAAEPEFALRAAMFQVENYKRLIEPQLRNPDRMPEVERQLADMLPWIDDPAFDRWIDRPIFQGDPERFLGWRYDMKQAAVAAREAASAANLDGLRDAFIRMNTTCIACHKRYQPNY